MDLEKSLKILDPTPNWKYKRWLYQEFNRGHFQLEDGEKINKLLVNFELVKRRLDSSDILKYSYPTLQQLIDSILDDKINFDSIDVDNENILYQGPFGKLSIPKTLDAAVRLGKGTKYWCISCKNNNQFLDFKDDIYIWRESYKKVIGIYIDFESGTGDIVNGKNHTLSSNTVDFYRNKHPILKQLFSNIESRLDKTAEKLFYYSLTIIQDRWLDYESLILSDTIYARKYISHVIKKQPHEFFSKRTREQSLNNKQ
jgi:hypothetical protein